MATSLKKHLNKILPNQKLLEVPTQWVENKHVDEIFTLLPTPSSSCGFAIGYASPELAMELMSDSADEAFWEITRDETSANNYNFDHCASSKSYLECPELIKANQAYQAEIERALVVIKDSLAKHCVDLKLIPLPQLFMPQKVFADYGTISDEARALNPSVVNSLLVGRHIFYSYQVFEPFGNYVEKTFSSLGLLPKPLESNSLQSSGGGFHCSSLMTNSCVK